MPRTRNEESLRTWTYLWVKCDGDILVGRILSVSATEDKVVFTIDDIDRPRKLGGGTYDSRKGEKFAECLGLFVLIL